MAGFAGALASILGVVIPSFVIILFIAIVFTDFRHNPFVDAAFKGMRPAVVALIVVPVISLARGLNRVFYAVIAVTALAIWHWGWSPVGILLGAAVAGIAWELFIAKKGIR